LNFAAATGLWLGLIALPIIALYILKIRRHRRTVPYLELWQKLVSDRQFSTLFRKLQRILSLILQLLIALCLVLALASLTLSDSFLEEESVALIIDTSASMTGRESEDSERTRLEAAVERARELVEGRSAEDEFAVIAAGAEPEVLQGFSRSTLRLREALDAVAPTKAAGSLESAHRLARDLLQDKEHPRIVLLCDGAAGEAERLAGEDEDVRWLRVGETVENLAILRFQARKNHAVGTDYLLLVVTNLGEREARAQVEISLQGKLRKVVPIELGPGGEYSDVIPVTLPEGGFATARIVHPAVGKGALAKPGRDGLALDDLAWAAIPSAKLYSVLLVTRNEAEAVPFTAALGELGRLEDLVNPESSYAVTEEQWNAMDAERRAAFDLVVFAAVSPEELPSSGNFFCIHALPGGLPATVRPVEEWPRIRDLDREHPLNRFLEPKGMAPARALPLDLTGGEVFMQTAGGPVGVVFKTANRKVVYLGLDMLSDLFFLQFAFPIMVRNALGWMHEQESALLEATYRPGDVIRPKFAIPEPEVLVRFRRGEDPEERAELPVRDGRFFFRDTEDPGRFWVFTSQAVYRTAVNLFERGESDLRVPETENATGIDVERSGFLFGRDLWPLLLLLALVLWMAEWGLFHRRLTE